MLWVACIWREVVRNCLCREGSRDGDKVVTAWDPNTETTHPPIFPSTESHKHSQIFFSVPQGVEICGWKSRDTTMDTFCEGWRKLKLKKHVEPRASRMVVTQALPSLISEPPPPNLSITRNTLTSNAIVSCWRRHQTVHCAICFQLPASAEG